MSSYRYRRTQMYDPQQNRMLALHSAAGAGAANPREGEVIAVMPPEVAGAAAYGYAPTTRPTTYAATPSAVKRSTSEMQGATWLERGLYMYTQRLGLNFSLVLLLALIYQIGVAVFIGLNGIKTLPMFWANAGIGGGVGSSPITSTTNTEWWVNPVAITMAVVIQLVLIAELAQVVWLRHPDRLKVRLMSSSVWWWLMLVALVVTSLINFLLLFLSVTGQTNLGAAWNFVMKNQMTGMVNLVLALLNFLTLIRCAAVMRTATSQEIHAEVEERLSAIAEEILIDAGDDVRAKTTQVWQQLSVNPRQLVPLYNSVLDKLLNLHPDQMPSRSRLGQGQASWAYDFTGNTLLPCPRMCIRLCYKTRSAP